MERLTNKCWMNLDPWKYCGQDDECWRESKDEGGCENGCIVTQLYRRLAAYEDTGLEPDDIVKLKSIKNYADAVEEQLLEYIQAEKEGRLVAVPPNDQLTVDELQKMDGPVWCRVDNCSWITDGGFWCLCNKGRLITPAMMQHDCKNLDMNLWQLYRRKPEEGTI